MIQRNFWRNVLPSVIAFAFSGVYSIVDGMFVGQGVGDAGLAAINVAWPVTALVQALGTGLGMAAAVVLSVCIGRRDAAEEHRALGSTAVLLLLAGVLSTALLALLYRPLLPLLGAEGSVLAYADSYTRVIVLGSLFQVLGTGLVPLLRTYDGADAAMCSMTAGFLTNVVLDALFISVFRWGTAGAAAATVIAQGVSAAGIALYGWRRVPLLRLERRHCKVSRGELGRIMNYSLLTCVQQSVMNFGILMVQGLVNSFGVNVMAAFAAAVKIDAFAYLPVQDFGNAFSTFVAQNTGAQKTERIRRGIRSALWVSVGFCLVSSLLVCLFAAPLMGLFVEPGETEIIAVGVEYLRIEGMCYCGIGILFLLYGLFRGLGRPGVSVVLTVVSLGTRVALAYLLAPIPAVGLKGIWWAVPIGWVLADLAGLVLYRRKPLPAETACAPEG